MNASRLVGAILILVGSIAGIANLGVQLFAVQFQMPYLVLVVITLAAAGVIAPGCIVLSAAFRGRARAGFLVAGLAGLPQAALSVARALTGFYVDDTIQPVTSLLAVGGLVVGAVLLVSDGKVRGGARWSLAVPAACTLFLVAILYVVRHPLVLILPSVGWVVAGVMLLAAGGASVARPVSPAYPAYPGSSVAPTPGDGVDGGQRPQA